VRRKKSTVNSGKDIHPPQDAKKKDGRRIDVEKTEGRTTRDVHRETESGRGSSSSRRKATQKYRRIGGKKRAKNLSRARALNEKNGAEHQTAEPCPTETFLQAQKKKNTLPPHSPVRGGPDSHRHSPPYHLRGGAGPATEAPKKCREGMPNDKASAPCGAEVWTGRRPDAR